MSYPSSTKSLAQPTVAALLSVLSLAACGQSFRAASTVQGASSTVQPQATSDVLITNVTVRSADLASKTVRFQVNLSGTPASTPNSPFLTADCTDTAGNFVYVEKYSINGQDAGYTLGTQRLNNTVEATIPGAVAGNTYLVHVRYWKVWGDRTPTSSVTKSLQFK